MYSCGREKAVNDLSQSCNLGQQEEGNIMFEMDQVTEFLGWCVVINIVLLSFSAVMILLFKDQVAAIHRRWFSIERAELETLYFNWLGNYKLINVVFFLVPYFALKIMG